MIDLQSSLYAAVLGGVLHRLGYEKKSRPFSDYIAFRETQKAAKAAGLSVSDFIERKHMVGTKTALEITIEGMESLGVFRDPIDQVCELGPGSGRYLGKIKERCQPAHYEIYETSIEWKEWLVEKYGVLAKQADGRSLSATQTESIDLMQAHKLFPGLPLLLTLSYFQDMARVVRNDGWIVFDIMTEQCFDRQNLKAWFDINPWEWDWSPSMCARQYVIETFASLNIVFVGSFLVPLYPAVTECHVFRKAKPASAISAG